MRLVYGTIRFFEDETRIFEILLDRKVQKFYLTRSQYKKFKPYLSEGLVVHFTCKDDKIHQAGYSVYEVISFIKMVRHMPRKTIVYYDLSTIKQGVKKIINRDGYRMFLDLEFTMPPHGYTHGSGFVSEIIQYGFCLEDEEGQIINYTAWLANNDFYVSKASLTSLTVKGHAYEDGVISKKSDKEVTNTCEDTEGQTLRK